MTLSEFETYGTTHIICPYCGHADRDSWEWDPDIGSGEGDGSTECGGCEREFLVSRCVSVTYITGPLKFKLNT